MRLPCALAILAALASSALAAEAVAAANDTDDDLSDGVDGAPVVEFVGGAPKLKIYPAGSSVGGSTWIMLTFGKIQELTSSGAKVTEHSIMSLASESGIIWTQDNRDVGGTTALVTRMELALEYGGSFKQCAASGGNTAAVVSGSGHGNGNGSGSNLQGAGGGNGNVGGSNTQGAGGGNGNGGNGNGGNGKSASNGIARRLQVIGSIAIEVFLFTEAATIEYGSETIQVGPGQMKFNIESQTWPFCAADNKLEVNIDIKTPSGGSGGGMSNVADANGPPSNRFMAGAGDSYVTMDLPTVTLIDGVLSDCDVALDLTGGKMNLAFTFPAFASSVVYDPTVQFASDSTTGVDSSTTSSADTTTQDGTGTSSEDTTTQDGAGTTSEDTTTQDGASTSSEDSTSTSASDGTTTLHDITTSSSDGADTTTESDASTTSFDSDSDTSSADGDRGSSSEEEEYPGSGKETDGTAPTDEAAQGGELMETHTEHPTGSARIGVWPSLGMPLVFLMPILAM